MKKLFSLWISALPVLLLIPYLITAAFNGAETALVYRIPDGEMCLPVLLSLQIPGDYEPEALKAQAVIARSNLYLELAEGNSLPAVLKKAGEKVKNTYSFLSFPFFKDMELYGRAAEETKSQILTWKGEPKLVPYHAVSSGQTRDGEEAFHSGEYAYLKSVDSSIDREAPDYLKSVYVAAVRLPKELVIKSRDAAGYVTALTADGKTLEGEAFRRGMGLSSAAFRVQKIGNKIRFLCKGKGHGLGFSQYGGNQLAKDGSTWEEILTYYFPEMEISKGTEKNYFRESE